MATPDEQKPPPDWERIEADYRAGIKSLREIVEPYKLTEGAVRKRAKRDGWVRDLGAKIKARADDLVRRDAVRVPSTQLTPATEKEVVEENAQLVAGVERGHRSTATRAQALVVDLMAELEAQTGNIDLFEQLGELLDRSTDDSEGRAKEDKLNKIYRAVISMGGRVDGLKKLVETFERLVKVERQAYRIDDNAEPPHDPSDTGAAVSNETARRIAFLLTKGLRAQKD